MASVRGMAYLVRPFFRFGPVKNTLLPNVDESHDYDAEVDQHLPESKHAAGSQQLLVNDRPGNQKDGFYVEKNEQHSDHVELYREAAAGVARWSDAALIGAHFVAVVAVLTQHEREQYHARAHQNRDRQLHEQGNVGQEVAVVVLHMFKEGKLSRPTCVPTEFLDTRRGTIEYSFQRLQCQAIWASVCRGNTGKQAPNCANVHSAKYCVYAYYRRCSKEAAGVIYCCRCRSRRSHSRPLQHALHGNGRCRTSRP